MTEFKVGDRVRVRADSKFIGQRGLVGTILQIRPHVLILPIRVKFEAVENREVHPDYRCTHTNVYDPRDLEPVGGPW